MGAYSETVVALGVSFRFGTDIFDGGRQDGYRFRFDLRPAGADARVIADAGRVSRTLAGQGKCVVMMRDGTDVCSVYVGDPAGEEDDLTRHGTISAAVADEILELTQVGVNRMTVGDQTYRFFRSFTHIADVGAVTFAPA
jgi:hypothetical protein